MALKPARPPRTNALDYDNFFTETYRSTVNKRLDPIEMKPRDQSADAASYLPELHSDDADPNLKEIIQERYLFGVRPSDAEMFRLRERGYASYFMTIGKPPSRIGGRRFNKLNGAGRHELTTEYVLFHRVHDRLDPEIRQKIGAILADSVSHPHAKWENRPQS